MKIKWSWVSWILFLISGSQWNHLANRYIILQINKNKNEKRKKKFNITEVVIKNQFSWYPDYYRLLQYFKEVKFFTKKCANLKIFFYQSLILCHSLSLSLAIILSAELTPISNYICINYINFTLCILLFNNSTTTTTTTHN